MNTSATVLVTSSRESLTMYHLPRWRRHLRLVGVLWFMLIPHFVAPHSNAAVQLHMLSKVWSGHYHARSHWSGHHHHTRAAQIASGIHVVSDSSENAPIKLRHGHHYPDPGAQLPAVYGQEATYFIRSDSEIDRPWFIAIDFNAPLNRLL